jgi:hypothetical protein
VSGCGSEATFTDGPASIGPETPSAAEDPGTAERPDASEEPGGQDEDVEATGPSKAELKAYVGSAQKQMKATYGDMFDKTYSSMRIEPDYPHGIEYVYVYKRPVDAPRVVDYLETTVPLLKKVVRTQVAPELERLGIAEPTVTWTYRNSDETLIWKRTMR